MIPAWLALLLVLLASAASFVVGMRVHFQRRVAVATARALGRQGILRPPWRGPVASAAPVGVPTRSARSTPGPIGDGVGWPSIAARMLIADTLGDQHSVAELLDELLQHNHPNLVRVSMLLWCDMALQAGCVITGGHVVGVLPCKGPGAVRVSPEIRWAGELLSARAAGDHERINRLFRKVPGITAMQARMLQLLDVAGTIITHAMRSQPEPAPRKTSPPKPRHTR